MAISRFSSLSGPSKYAVLYPKPNPPFLTYLFRQIMDPKMDSGALDSDELLGEDYDVSRPLLPAEVIGIIDQLLCLEVRL